MIDPTIASRVQFAVTTFVHIIFPTISMGLAPFLVYFTWKEIRTDETIYANLRSFWAKIFGITFVAGTVTGIVLEFEFGMNFASFSAFVGEVMGGPLAVEGMMAFFLESTFLGVFIFGRERVSDRLYMLSAFLVALGSWLSAVWILIANAWMQTPQGYNIVMEGGQRVVELTDPIAAYANPRFPWMFVHMQTSAVLSASLFMAGIAGYYLWLGRDSDFWKKTLKVAVVLMLITAPFQVLHGDSYTRHVEDTQPAKFAAMEAQYETETGADLHLIAIPKSLDSFTDPRAQNLWTIDVPNLASVLASGGDLDARIRGLNEISNTEPWEGAGTPPVAFVFWSFRAMVLLGLWFIVLAFWAGYRWYKGTLFESSRLHQALALSTPLGVVAVEVGWMVTEIGRQPWIVQEIMTVDQGRSPGLTGGEATITLAGFVGGYLLMLTLWIYVVRRMIRNAPDGKQPSPDDRSGILGVAGDD
jgi:cytochrome d ubiquinol oxidase subunit I